MSVFEPRKTRPLAGNKYYNTIGNGGYSHAIKGNVNGTGKPDSGCDVLANCVGYAYGRFNEIGKYGYCKYLTPTNAENFIENRGSLTHGQTPALGACMVWRKGATLSGSDGAGHVAIVEEIISPTQIVTSESGWGSNVFWTQTRNKGSDGNWGMSSSYHFRGFIYNPAVDGGTVVGSQLTDSKLNKFISVAMSHVGEDGTWSWKNAPLDRGQPWCAAFVTACAKAVGGLNGVIMSCSNGCTTFARTSTENKYGTWIKGPCQGGSTKPRAGDLIFYRWDTPIRSSTYDSDHIGIVYKVDENYVYTVEGNTNGNGSNYNSRVNTFQRKFASSCINAYFRPNWAKVGVTVYSWDGSDSFSGTVYYNTDIYQGEKNDEYDSTIREICYYDQSSNKPSISTTEFRLSIVNYTTSLASFVNNLNIGLNGGVIVGGDYSGTTDTSNLSGNQKIIVEQLMKNGFKPAAAIGLLANIYAESSCRPSAVGDNGTSFGICQWHNERGTAMKKYVGANWSSNLSGQIDYLIYDLNTNFRSLLSYINNIDNNVSGAKAVADRFVRDFERPAAVNSASVKRQQYAEEFWSKLIIQQKV